MIFGAHMVPAETTAPADWIDDACHGDDWTVGALVPNQYEAVLRVFAPAPCETWWSLYRDVFDIVAGIGERHTSSPDRAWFAVWEGHGFANASSRIAHSGPLDEEQRRELDRRRAELRDEDAHRNAAIRAALSQVPRFHRPHRAYYLMSGTVAAVTELRYPGFDDEWRNPDLLWPDDRSWFVATDIDFWSLYIGGTRAFIDELAGAVPTRAVLVDLDARLEIED